MHLYLFLKLHSGCIVLICESVQINLYIRSILYLQRDVPLSRFSCRSYGFNVAVPTQFNTNYFISFHSAV